MSEEKQIEEMAQAILYVGDTYNTLDEEDCKTIAWLIYEKGYRKQSEGEWISNSEKFSNIYDSFYCSSCKNYTTERNPYRLSKYCPFCGAKMNGAKQVFNEGGFESKALKGGE